MTLTPQDLALIRRKASEVDADGFPVFQRDNQNALIVRMLDHIAQLDGALRQADSWDRQSKERAKKAEADCQVWCERHNGLEIALSDSDAKVRELQAIVEKVHNRMVSGEGVSPLDGCFGLAIRNTLSAKGGTHENANG